MVKQITVTVRDRVYDDIIEKRPEGMSRSEWVEDLIIKGSKAREKEESGG